MDFNHIAKKWQSQWESKKIFEVKEDSKKKKSYVLQMFPYPSGTSLHMGHAKNYVIGDIVARHKRMLGFNVLQPMGYDAFGLPAENAAIKNKSHPKVFTDIAIKGYIQQSKALGLSYDWSRVLATCYPDYYKWNQWFFLKFYERGLAYKKKAPVNWCNSCQTVLANEQVEQGKCWRCHNEVSIKQLEQWFFKITDYAERLLQDLSLLAGWPERIRTMQSHWIGKSEGATIFFPIKDSKEKIEVFTTRPDTIYGVNCIIFAPEHPQVLELVKGTSYQAQVHEFINKVVIKERFKRGDEDQEKEGLFIGKYAVNPLTKEELPIYIANFILLDYGTGAIMSVPAHDERDFAFAKKYDLPIKTVIQKEGLNCVLVHGSPEKDQSKEPSDIPQNQKPWYVWTKKKLEECGYKVTLPLMPKSWLPDYADWKREFEKTEVNEKSVLIGHSAGTAFLVRWLGETKRKIKKLILVAPGKISSNDRVKALYDFKINKEIKKLVDEIIIFISNDAQHHIDSAKLYEKELDGQLIEIENKGHFRTSDMGTGEFLELLEKILDRSTAYTDNGILINSGSFNGLSTQKAKSAIIKELQAKKIGAAKQHYKLRDWLVSRQRYWGTPIPMVYCTKCGIVPVPEKELPIKLPEKVEFTGEGNPLAKTKEFVNVNCPKCRSPAKRETDTMDTFVDSSWYFLRFCDANNDQAPFDKDKVKYWMPVNQYTGGAEHAVMHLLYARFFTKALKDMKMLDIDEPFVNLFNQGMLHKDGVVMSKSKGNIITQDEISQKYGIDTGRWYLMSVASPDKDIEWDEKGVEGSFRALNKIVALIENAKYTAKEERIEAKMHKTIKEVSETIESMTYNMGLIKLMEFVAYLQKQPAVTKESVEVLIKLISPFVPHLAEELWEMTKHKGFVCQEDWPKYNEKKIDPKIDAAEELVENTTSDIQAVLNLVKIKPKEITLFVAEKWKYPLFKKLHQEENRDFSALMKKFADKEHGQDVGKIVQHFMKGALKTDIVLSPEEELDALKENKPVWEKQFGAKFNLVHADSSKEPKAKQAIPGKVAILIK